MHAPHPPPSSLHPQTHQTLSQYVHLGECVVIGERKRELAFPWNIIPRLNGYRYQISLFFTVSLCVRTSVWQMWRSSGYCLLLHCPTSKRGIHYSARRHRKHSCNDVQWAVSSLRKNVWLVEKRKTTMMGFCKDTVLLQSQWKSSGRFTSSIHKREKWSCINTHMLVHTFMHDKNHSSFSQSFLWKDNYGK